MVSSGYYDEFYKPLDKLLNTVIGIIITTLLLILSLSLAISSSITKPINTLIDYFSKGIKGDFSARMDVKSNDEIGKLAKYFNFFMDQIRNYKTGLENEIREREEASEELIIANEKLRSIHDKLLLSNENLSSEKELHMTTLRSIGDGVITTDKEGNVMFINIAAEKIIDCRQVDVFNLPISRVIQIINEISEAPVENPVETVIKTGEIIELESDIKLVTKLGIKKSIFASAAPIKDSLSKIIGTVMVIRDITERKKLQNELHKASKIESLGVFAGGIAHDFNNLLTVIIGNISMVKAGIHDENEFYNILDDAEKASLNAKNLTNQLLTFSKGSDPIRKSASIINLIKKSADFVLSGSNVRCDYRIEKDLWNANADIGQFTQVVYNIIINARQSMPGGGIILISAGNYRHEYKESIPLESGDYILIKIKDSGKGIPQDHLKKIFDPYFTTKPDGTGLGLSICHSIISKHNGYIAAESTAGSGAEFIIYLPASMEPEAAIQTAAIKQLRHEGKILIMDDEDSILRTAERMAVMLGFEAVCAKDGREAIDLFKKSLENNEPFKFVIMDLTIPGGMGGKEAVKYINELDPSARIIVSSGYSNDPVMAKYKEYGFSGIIVKPYRFEEMAELFSSIGLIK